MELKKPALNPPQLYRIQYAFVEAVDAILNLKSFAAVIQLKDQQQWQNIYGTPSGYTYSETPEKRNSGTLYQQSLRLLYPGTDPLAQDFFISLQDRPLILLNHYQDGFIRVMGSLDAPTLLSLSFESGSRTGFTATFQRLAPSPSRFLYPDAASVP